MGCDIHFHSEVKIKGKWYHHSEARIYRDYELFAKMADVRNDGSIAPISTPKGLPEDITFLTKLHSETIGEDGHSHSWLNADEIKMLDDWLNNNSTGQTRDQFPVFMGNRFRYFKDNLYDFKQVEDVRFVFWFDN